MLSPRVLVRGNPARAKFATENKLLPTTHTVYPKKYAHGFCFAVLCCGYTLTDFPISIRLTSLALWQSNDCPSASKATLMNMDKYFMWIHYERLHNHNKTKHNKIVCIFLGIYCICSCIWCRPYSDNQNDLLSLHPCYIIVKMWKLCHLKNVFAPSKHLRGSYVSQNYIFCKISKS